MANTLIDSPKRIGSDLWRRAVLAVNLDQAFAAVEGMVGNGCQLTVQGDGREAGTAGKGKIVDFGQGGGP